MTREQIDLIVTKLEAFIDVKIKDALATPSHEHMGYYFEVSETRAELFATLAKVMEDA